MTIVLHITSKHAWDEAVRAGVYTTPSLVNEGFIHCSTVNQTADTANRYFRGHSGLVLLLIDEGIASAEMRYEPPASSHRAEPQELYPHLYGPLNLDAVIKVIDFRAGPGGAFALPEAIAELDFIH
jgi:uncharacterized protein (DUF952 family)